MATRTTYSSRTPYAVVESRRRSRVALPSVGEDLAREALQTSFQLQIRATELNPEHRARARSSHRRLVALRLVLLLAVLVSAVAALLFVPFTDWWSSVQDASTGAE